MKKNNINTNFLNKKIFITGAAGNLGSMMALNFADLGADLILVDNSKSKLDKLKNKLLKKKINFNLFYSDLEKESERLLLINSVYKLYNSLDIIINNAGFVGQSKLDGWNTKFANQSLNTWKRAFEVNLTAPFHLVQSFEKLLNNSKNPSIINISSIYGELGPKWHLYDGTKMGNPAAYAASKGGLLQFTRWLAITLAPKIRVNAVCLGGVLNNQPNIFVKKYEKEVPLNRMANDEDLMGTIMLLASDMSLYITGQSVKVDGGWSSW